ncbi:MAG: STAS domain-containing protein [Chloroflexota bacterium]
MDITTTQFKNCDVVAAKGRVDSSTAPELEAAFKGLLEQGRYKLVFDMRDITFVSSAGWWVLIGAQKTCKKHNGEVVIANIADGIHDSLKLVGMDDYFQIFDDLTAAVGNV